ncbi:MAG: TlpA disulfide reductase family protein [Pyrinomonadaceae bacterium]
MNRFWQIIILVALLTGGAVFIALPLNSRTADTAKQILPAASKATTRVSTAIGDAAPDFQLATIDGAAASLAGLRGQPAVLVFWTAWCPTCKEEAPHFNELAARYESRGVRVLGINIQDSLARTQSGIKDFGIRYAVARDADASVARRYNVTGTPTIVFLDKLGVVRYFANALPDDYPERLDALIAAQ